MSKLTNYTVEVDEYGERTYLRKESNTTRGLRVWSMQSCRKKLAGNDPLTVFKKAAEWHFSYCTGGDPMFQDWSAECFQRMEHAYNELSPLDATLHVLEKVIAAFEKNRMVAPVDTIEEFGLDELEDFGI